MEQRLQEIAAELLKIANEIEKAPQVEAEEPVELIVGNHEIMFLRVTPDGNKLYSIKYSTQN